VVNVKRALALLIFLQACAPSSSEDFYHEGEALVRELTLALVKIETREDLMAAAPKLKEYFGQLVSLMIEARKFEKENEEFFDLSHLDRSASDALLGEMRRIYKLEAGRETIEKAQKEALLKLDSFHYKSRK